MKLILSIIFLLLSNLQFTIAQAKTHLFVVSGVVVNSGASEKIIDLIAMIERKSGYKLKPFYVKSYKHLSEVLRKNPDAIAWTCGAPYVEDAVKDGQQLIAVPLFKGVPLYNSLIVTRKTEQGTRLTDFKNKIFVFSDLRSNSGYVAPATLLKKSGKSMDDFFRIKMHAGIHEKSIEAIYRGVADVGAIDEYVWVEYIKLHPEISTKLHVIEQSGPFPFTPIVAGKEVAPEVIASIKDALINMTSQELTKFKEDFFMDGFVEKDNDFFLPIKENMRFIGFDLSVQGP